MLEELPVTVLNFHIEAVEGKSVLVTHGKEEEGVSELSLLFGMLCLRQKKVLSSRDNKNKA